MKRKVVILQHRLLHYRVQLFEKLKQLCFDNNIELHLVHGQASDWEKSRQDEGSLPWADKVYNIYFRVAGKDLLWQPFPLMHLDANLVVIMQENRILSNYPFLIWRIVGGPKIAYWGHGINFQSSAPTGLRERWKKLLIRHVDWWFAYTRITVDILLAAGFENRKITCLDNAIDTYAFRNEVSSISNGELEIIRQQLRIDENARIGLFCGSLYPDKKLELLIDSADKIRDREPRFHLIVIGNGPSADMLNRVSQSRSWMHMVGVKKGREKAIYFRLAQVMLNPGATGLHILDAFSIGIPFVSTINARHSPEIVYLQNGVNGVLTEDSVDTYSNVVLDLLCNESLREKISRNALVTGEQYTVDRMACNFINGIEKCLDSAP